jgi:hypothetical protein
VGILTNRHLIDYAKGRGISPDTLKQYCKEVIFTSNKKQLYGIGFENIKGGYEIRNKFYKGCIAPKDISFLDNDSKSCCVFEGFFDFLSFIELKKNSFPTTDFLILNSTALIKNAIALLHNYKRVLLFLDNDEPGQNTKRMIEESVQADITDYTKLYKGYDDLNDYLMCQSK